jgi:hypothetical protein
MRKAIAVSIAVLLLSLGACSSPTDPVRSALTAELKAESTTLVVGDSTALRLVVRNNGGVPLFFEVGTIPFDLSVGQEDVGELWRFSHQPTTGPATRLIIPARDSVVLPMTLRIGGRAGVNILQGRYQLRGFLLGVGNEVIVTASPVLDLTVRP